MYSILGISLPLHISLPPFKGCVIVHCIHVSWVSWYSSALHSSALLSSTKKTWLQQSRGKATGCTHVNGPLPLCKRTHAGHISNLPHKRGWPCDSPLATGAKKMHSGCLLRAFCKCKQLYSCHAPQLHFVTHEKLWDLEMDTIFNGVPIQSQPPCYPTLAFFESFYNSVRERML